MKTEAEKGQENSSKKESVCIDESLGMENASPEMEISRKSTKNQDSSRPLGNGSPASETSEKDSSLTERCNLYWRLSK